MEYPVSLVIKASFQGEGDMLYRQIRHIVTMLEKRRFCEVILVFDSKINDFIRQYSNSSKEEIIRTAESLVNDGYIDGWIVSPTDEKSVTEIYRRWFGSETTETHSINNSPMTQQLYAFEITKGIYTLQADADVIICRRDWNHDYLNDMIAAIESEKNVVSIGFNIAHKSSGFIPYSSPELGEYVPEVRICLFNKERFLSLRPFPNEIIDGKYKLTWYRAVQKLQKERGLISYRGGDGRTFYIHPQNNIKTDLAYLYGVIKKVEHNQIPEIQFESVDLVGNSEDWGLKPAPTNRFHQLWHIIRASKLGTFFYGCEFPTNLRRIEIDITYDCNLRCRNCARSCSQAPDITSMSPDQIEKFVQESQEHDVIWEIIGVLGGEPMLHPELSEILEVLLNYKEDYSPNTRIEVTTNGYREKVVEAFSKVPAGIFINNTRKQNAHQEKFEPFNLAPVDQWKFYFSDYRNGCSTTSDCGLGLNAYGYYHCGIAGSIDRVMGFDIGLKKLPLTQKELVSQKEILCKYCGHFCSRHYTPENQRPTVIGSPMSRSWINAYRLFNSKKPVLREY